MLIPQLAPSSVADTRTCVPPPARFRPLVGVPTDVRWKHQQYYSITGMTAAQRRGLRYEALVNDYIHRRLGDVYHVTPHLHFLDGSDRRTCVPDGIHIDTSGRATVFEIKAQHMPEAWWQLRGLYEPVVQQLRFVNVVSCVEVTRSYDPLMGFPEEVVLCRDLTEVFLGPSAPFKVLLWKP